MVRGGGDAPPPRFWQFPIQGEAPSIQASNFEDFNSCRAIQLFSIWLLLWKVKDDVFRIRNRSVAGQICVYFVDLAQCFCPVADLLRRDPTRVQSGRRLGKDVQQTCRILGLILQWRQYYRVCSLASSLACLSVGHLVWQLVQVGLQQVISPRLRHPDLMHSNLEIINGFLLLPQTR